jgi:hypothetical protein
MLRRLCLFLMTLCLALPAMAAPLHCVPPMAVATHQAQAHHGKTDMPIEQTAKHDCIGCIARYSTSAPLYVADLIATGLVNPLGDQLLARLTSGPDTPPPRA